VWQLCHGRSSQEPDPLEPEIIKRFENHFKCAAAAPPPPRRRRRISLLRARCVARPRPPGRAPTRLARAVNDRRAAAF
jgi:hypothetical protein